MLGNFISPYDATVVENIRKSFGIPSLKANMDEFGMGSSMLNSAFGPCVNPWSPPNDHRKITPGGSSGASAVAVG